MPSDTLKEAIQHLENGKLATAKTILDHLVKNEPDNPGIYHYLGSIALMQEKPDTAITLLKTAIDLKQDDYKFHEAMGQAYGLKAQQSGFLKASKAIKKSKNSFTKAIELNPKAVGSLEGLFMIYLFMPRIAGGDEKKAMQLIEEMNTMIPARGHSLRAFYFLKIKEVAKAEEEYKKAAELASDDAEIQMRVGHYFMNSDNPSMALEYFNHYIELKPKDPRGYEFKGDYFDQKNDIHSALQMYDMALDKESKHHPARLKKGKMLLKLDKIEEARVEFQHIIENSPEDPIAKEAQASMAS